MKLASQPGMAKVQVARELAIHEDLLKSWVRHFVAGRWEVTPAKALKQWLQGIDAKTLYIVPGSPWENGYCESFNGTPKVELLNREIFNSLKEAHIVIERWRREYNEVRPHSSLGYRPPAPAAGSPRPLMLAQPHMVQ